MTTFKLNTNEYNTNDNDNYTLNKGDLGMIIGKNASGIKFCLNQSWKLYESYTKSKQIKEPKPTIKIKFIEENDDIYVEVHSESKIMINMGHISVKKHILNCKRKQTTRPYTFVAEYPEHLMGLLIGKNGSKLKDIIDKSIYDNDKINDDDVDVAKKSRLKIKMSEYTKDELLAYIENNQNVSYLGWPIDKNKELKDHILITLTFPKNITTGLNDRDKFILNMNDILLGNIQEILSKNNQDIYEIDEEIDDFNFNI